MSFLTPLFLVALGALVIPIFLHLARRRTRRELPFGSLRFLSPSPPRFESRRRIEHLALLALRCLALALLVGTFARPFFTRPLPGVPVTSGRRLLVLLDTSASMRREGLWEQALARVRVHIDRVEAADRVALLAFDRRLRVLMRFDEGADAAPADRVGLLSARLAATRPGWSGTDLGAALVGAAESLLDDETARRGGPAVAEQVVVLVSDLQQGSRLLALGASDWPRGVRLVVDPVTARAGPNFGLAAIAEPRNQVSAAAASPSLVKVRVIEGGNAPGRVRGTLRWQTGQLGADRSSGRSVDVDLAMGESRVVELPRPSAGPGILTITGDADAFDNRLAIAPSIPRAVQVLYLGMDETGDARAPLYFLERALPSTASRAPRIIAHRPSDPQVASEIPRAHLVVVTAEPGPALFGPLRAHLERGRTVLYVPAAGDRGAALAALAGTSGVSLREAPAGREAVLTEIDLSHPVLAPFGDGRFSDFTKVRFWKRRLLDLRALPEARVLARFDDGAPAWVALRVGRGLLWVMTAGWHPADSQLALSSKFVPLLWSLLETSAGLGSGQAQFFVGDPVVLPPAAAGGTGEAPRIRTPSGARVPVPEGAGVWSDSEEPGLYTLEAAGQPALVFAVNLPPSESLLSPLPLENLERLGIELQEGGAGRAANSAAAVPDRAAERRRQEAFLAELEGQQRSWRWVLAAVLLVLVGETVLAGRLRHPSRSTPSTLGTPEDVA
jgi:hypothetical protein